MNTSWKLLQARMMLGRREAGVQGLQVSSRWRRVIMAGPGAIADGLAAGLAAGLAGSAAGLGMGIGMGAGAGAAAQRRAALSHSLSWIRLQRLVWHGTSQCTSKTCEECAAL